MERSLSRSPLAPRRRCRDGESVVATARTGAGSTRCGSSGGAAIGWGGACAALASQTWGRRARAPRAAGSQPLAGRIAVARRRAVPQRPVPRAIDRRPAARRVHARSRSRRCVGVFRFRRSADASQERCNRVRERGCGVLRGGFGGHASRSVDRSFGGWWRRGDVDSRCRVAFRECPWCADDGMNKSASRTGSG